MAQPLPIDAHLSTISKCLDEGPALVLEAEPGAGKTTRVPPYLAGLSWCGSKQVIVTQPRRVAARLAAVRVAQEWGCDLGAEVGYEVRHERKVSKDSRVVFVTEGILVRRMLAGDNLQQVGAIVLDEFHERSLETDFLVAALREGLRRGATYKLVVMSATMDTKRLAAYLQYDVLHCSGQTYPVALEYAPDRDDNLPRHVARVVQRHLESMAAGTILVFLPGVYEIQQCVKACSTVAARYEAQVVPLHGRQKLVEQERAVSSYDGRRVVLATNVAETSVTVPDLVAVIDSGLERISELNPVSGLSSLVTRRAPKASLTQRAGRAGRVQEGRCTRLFSKIDEQSRNPHATAAILTDDLTPFLLWRKAMEPYEGELFEEPPEASLRRSQKVLRALNAVDCAGELTDAGRDIVGTPLHPRLGRVLLEASRLGVASEVALALALLSEVPTAADPEARSHHDCDVWDLWERYHKRRGLDAPLLRRVSRVAKGLGGKDSMRIAGPEDETWTRVRQSLLAGFVDCVAEHKAHGEYLLAYGGRAQSAPSCSVRDAPFVVVLEASGGRGKGAPQHTLIRRATRIEPDWVLEFASGLVQERELVEWDDKRGVALAESAVTLGAVTLMSHRMEATPEQQHAVLLEQLAESRWENLLGEDRVASLRARARLLPESARSGLMERLDPQGLEDFVKEHVAGMVSMKEVRRSQPWEAWWHTLSSDIRDALERFAPTHLLLVHRRIPVTYELDQPPAIAGYIQDFFGLSATPTLGADHVAVQLTLWGPNRRPVQVTDDLESFWSRHYPQMLKQLSRRYPRHFWPTDPAAAQPRLHVGRKK